ncbi:MAG: YbaB/EbfC family nucleoid-associated protein [Lachnospiraceae bacterium]|nr:YbaB/EbfC family nucleoid-associated protein [Lachnospiraceae bacterium]
MGKGRGGFGGAMPGNMNNLMKQAQRMQRQMEEAQKQLEEMTFEGSAGGGVVKVTVTGKKAVTNVTINPEAVDPDDVEMLQDLILAAVNEALTKVDEASESKMGAISGGLNIPGMF